MRNSDVDLIVAKVTKRISSRLRIEARDEEAWQRIVAEDVEREMRYDEWHRKSHFEHVLKIVLWWLLGAALGGTLLYCIVIGQLHDRNEKKEQEARWAQKQDQKERDYDQFNEMFSPIVKLVHEKDIAIYSRLADNDREILSRIDEIIEANPTINGNIRKMSDRLKGRFQSEIRDCERLEKRIVDLKARPDSLRNKAQGLDCETLTCRCECCEED